MSESPRPLDRMLQLLQAVEHRYSFKTFRESPVRAFFQRGSVWASATEADHGMIQIKHEKELHETAVELCDPEQATKRVTEIMNQEKLPNVR